MLWNLLCNQYSDLRASGSWSSFLLNKSGRLLTIKQCHFFRELSALQPISTPPVTAAEVCVEVIQKMIDVMSGTGSTLQARAVSR